MQLVAAGKHAAVAGEHFMTGFRRLAATGAAALVWALSAQISPAAAQTELILCNKTGARIDIAVAYQHATTGRWMLSAWHIRKPGECKTFAKIKTGLFYYHAKNERNTTVWPGKQSVERNYCVPNTAVTRDMNGSKCGQGDVNRGFRGRVPNQGKYSFSFS
jgi:uncharacterized membrane protein